jgi:hypothetical protein
MKFQQSILLPMNQKMLDLIKENLKDPSMFEVVNRAFVKQARSTAIVLGSFLIVALIAVVYAFVQQTEKQKISQELANQVEEVRLIKLESEKQAALVMEAKLIAEEANRMALEQLKECEQQRKK